MLCSQAQRAADTNALCRGDGNRDCPLDSVLCGEGEPQVACAQLKKPWTEHHCKHTLLVDSQLLISLVRQGRGKAHQQRWFKCVRFTHKREPTFEKARVV